MKEKAPDYLPKDIGEDLETRCKRLEQVIIKLVGKKKGVDWIVTIKAGIALFLFVVFVGTLGIAAVWVLLQFGTWIGLF